MTVSEKTQAKAAEYLLSGRVKVQYLTCVDPGNIEFLAHVHSANQEAGDPYYVKITENGWSCDCPARVPVCAHILACQTITDLDVTVRISGEEPTGPPKTFARAADLDAILGT